MPSDPPFKNETKDIYEKNMIEYVTHVTSECEIVNEKTNILDEFLKNYKSQIMNYNILLCNNISIGRLIRSS